MRHRAVGYIGNHILWLEWSRDTSGHVIDDVTWPQMVEVITPNIWGLISQKLCKNFWQRTYATIVLMVSVEIGNCPLRVLWSRDRWCHVALKSQAHNPQISKALCLCNVSETVNDKGLDTINHLYAYCGCHGYVTENWWQHNAVVKCVPLLSNDGSKC